MGHGREQDPKTPAAVREVDIAEPLAEMLRAFAEDKGGYLFSTRSGRPIGHRNVNRAAGVGVHALRRFRIETLRRARVPEELIGLWIGHAPRSITDLYAEGLSVTGTGGVIGARKLDSVFRGWGYMGL